ncbi:hypothetical protein [Sediminicoccus sp. KRV36]|uniref:esterase/lipase family protein n=1 Tax=Sediminicoccus sp. KRV36 TaxID=3133721 RepID=UPI0020108775|nr:hypothetical protein [Sediminicoccus rosea]UPY37959.1 hypothetical protein LHU95_04470 [Sediminicoccus rosea]
MGRAQAWRWTRRGLLLGGAAAAGGYATLKLRPAETEADLHLLYTPSAMQHGVDRNPIIVIPGLLGSRLRDPASGQIVWGAFEGTAADPGTATGARLVALPFTDAMRTPSELVTPDGVLDRVQLRVAGIPVALRAYAEILSTLGLGGYRDEALGLAGRVNYGSDHFTCFQFSYDWRQDNVRNAQRLMAFMREKRAFVQAEYARRFGMRDHPVKFDIVAHSMGGLVARYAMLFGDADLPADGALPRPSFAGAEYMARLIQIGTPNGGSLDAFRVLVDGRDFGQPIVPRYSQAILGTFASVYQLLPRASGRPVVAGEETLDLHEPATWQQMRWGLAGAGLDADLATLMPDVASAEERRRLALALQARLLRRARAFAAAMDQPATPPPGTELMLVAGDSMPTALRLSADRGDGRLTQIASGPGDGVVLRDSVLLDHRQGQAPRGTLAMSPMGFRRALFLPREHLEITRDATFRNNILFWLLEEQRGA